jgi:predicted dehydrogenase
LNTKIKIAIIGSGLMAKEHAKAFHDIADVEICGFYSRTRANTDVLAAQYQAPVFDSIKELYENTKADLVIITVNILAMHDTCLEAFKFPWKFLAEKPVGCDLEEALKIEKARMENKREVYVALNRRHYSSTKKLQHELEDKTGLRYIHVVDQEDIVAAQKAGQPELVIKNWMYANSIHLIDYFRILGRGQITQVKKVVPWNAQEPTHIVALIHYSSGDLALYEANWNRPGGWSVSVTVNESKYEMRPVETLSQQVYGSRKLEPLEIHPWDSQFKPGLRAQAEECVKALRGQAHSLPTLTESFETMQLIHQLYF